MHLGAWNVVGYQGSLLLKLGVEELLKLGGSAVSGVFIWIGTTHAWWIPSNKNVI
jgi:hypothetical protein